MDGRTWETPATVSAGREWQTAFGLPDDEPVAIPPGRYMIHLEATHYLAEPFPVTVRSGESATISVPLESATNIQLAFESDAGKPFASTVHVEVLHQTTGAHLASHVVPSRQRLTLELEPIDGGRRIRSSATGPDGETWTGEVAGRLSGGHRKDHAHAIILRPE